MRIKNYLTAGLAVLLSTVISSCNSNDDLGTQDIEIPGITFDGDID